MTQSKKLQNLWVLAIISTTLSWATSGQAEVRRGILFNLRQSGRSYDTSIGCDDGGECLAGPYDYSSPGGGYGYPSGGAEYAVGQYGCPEDDGILGWIGRQLQFEKWRCDEDARALRRHVFLHEQNKKKLLHRECPPYHDCHFGYYPTCWRPFPGQPTCSYGPAEHAFEQPGPYEDYLDYGQPIAPDAVTPDPTLEELPESFEVEPEPTFDSPPRSTPIPPQTSSEEDAPLPYLE